MSQPAPRLYRIAPKWQRSIGWGECVHGLLSRSSGHIGLMQDITDKQVAEEQIKHYYEQLQNSFLHTVELATTMGEMRDPYTAGHDRRVSSIAIKIRGSPLPFPSCANCDSFDIMLNTLKGYTPHRTPRAMPYAHAPCASCNAMPYAMTHAPCPTHTPCPMLAHTIRHALYPAPCHLH